MSNTQQCVRASLNSHSVFEFQISNALHCGFDRGWREEHYPKLHVALIVFQLAAPTPPFCVHSTPLDKAGYEMLIIDFVLVGSEVYTVHVSPLCAF